MDIKPLDNSVSRDATTSSTSAISSADRAQRSSDPSQGGNQSIDTVTLTDAVAQLIELQDSLARIPDVSSERVEAIRQALAEGLYEVDTERLAQNLVSSELQ